MPGAAVGGRELMRQHAARLRLGGSLVAAALFSPPLRAQTFTASSISQAAQDARREVGRLSRRADALLRLTVADGPERPAAAVRRFRAEQVGPRARPSPRCSTAGSARTTGSW